MFKAFESFKQLVTDQFSYGGQKYAHSGEREATDVLFERYGRNWLIGTIDKYTFRFLTCKREKDLLKIACYMFIMWLKRGFFIMSGGIDAPAIDTTVKIKSREFPTFLARVEMALPGFSEYFVTKGEKAEKDMNVDLVNILSKDGTANDFVISDEEVRQQISGILEGMGRVTEWRDISEQRLIVIFVLCAIIWERNFKDVAGQDADTYNEGRK